MLVYGLKHLLRIYMYTNIHLKEFGHFLLLYYRRNYLSKRNKAQEYNIYRIPVESVSSLIQHLESRCFEEITFLDGLFENNDLKPRAFFCDKENRKGIPWIAMLDKYCLDSLVQDVSVYGAVIIFQTVSNCFAISYGNAHFYMSKFCDHSFGISVAEHLIDLDKVNAQQNISYGTRLSKSHMDFRRPLRLSYSSGEFPSFIQGESNDPEKWGAKIVCGTSVQFKWEEQLPRLIQKLDMLQEVLNKTPKRKIAQMLKLDETSDAGIIGILNNELIQSLLSYKKDKTNGTINLPSFFLVGTRIMQSTTDTYRLTCDRKKKDGAGGLCLDDIISFWDENEFDYDVALNKTNVTTDAAKYQSILGFIEYVTTYNGVNYCFINSAWHTFNKEYIKNVHDRVNRIPFVPHKNDSFRYSPDDIRQALSPDLRTQKRVEYETLYNQNLSQLIGGTCLHPYTTEFVDGAKIQIELCDIYTQNSLYFVKIGGSGKFAEAADQALLTLEKIIHDGGSLTINDSSTITPSEIRLVLVYTAEKKREIIKISDIKSLKLLVHLTELDDQARQAGINLGIDFVYEDSGADEIDKLAS